MQIVVTSAHESTSCVKVNTKSGLRVFLLMGLLIYHYKCSSLSPMLILCVELHDIRECYNYLCIFFVLFSVFLPAQIVHFYILIMLAAKTV